MWHKSITFLLGGLLISPAAFAAGDPELFPILTALFYLVFSAQILGFLAARFGQPRVIGQVLAGILVGPHVLEMVYPNLTLRALAEFGAIFLMFMVGLETRLRDLLSVGKEAIIVAILGIVLPMAGGYLFGAFNDYNSIQNLFIGTAMVATSVGITAQVLAELGVIDRNYARIILGAAVIDDILGLSILGVVSAVAQGGELSVGDVVTTLGISIGFVIAVLALGVPLINRLQPKIDPMLVSGGFGLCISASLGFAALSGIAGLATIIGAFLIGMVLAEVRDQYDFNDKVHAVESFLAPVFFAMVGVQLPLDQLTSREVIINGLILTVVAILGKWLGGIAIMRSQGFANANKVGVGMVPRGEVGLIVVGLGLSAGILDNKLFAELIVMIILTTILAPIVLRILISREAARMPPPDARATLGARDGRGI